MSSEETRVAEAIEIVLGARFVPGEKPTADEAGLDLCHAFAVRFCEGTGSALQLRTFQKVGVSSSTVAWALRAGVLRLQGGSG